MALINWPDNLAAPNRRQTVRDAVLLRGDRDKAKLELLNFFQLLVEPALVPLVA